MVDDWVIRVKRVRKIQQMINYGRYGFISIEKQRYCGSNNTILRLVHIARSSAMAD